MLKNENIICISSIDWDFIWQGHQEIMSTFVRAGNRVLFIENTGVRPPGIRDLARLKRRVTNWFKGVEGIRQESDNLYVFSPLVLPFPYLRLARWINYRLIMSVLNSWFKAMDFGNPIIWTFLPTPLSSAIIDNLVKKFTIYYCIDNFTASSASARKIRKSENALLRKADLVFVTSHELHKHCSVYNDNVHFFPFTVSYDKFEQVRSNEYAVPDDLRGLKKPIIGYVGGVHKWVDQQLIKEVVRRHKDCSFVFVGPIQSDISFLRNLENVHFLGEKEHDSLPFYIKNFDICIIPYIVTDYTRSVYPTKLNEYLAMGKPVVSTGLPEIRIFNDRYPQTVNIAGNSEEFAEAIGKALSQHSPNAVKMRIEIARDNSWDSSIRRMNGLIEELLERKKSNIKSQWKVRLVAFYKGTRRRLVSFAAVCGLLYVILLKLPFIWFIASPLMIAQYPQKADAIVVFGGGVGETGSPGKSTIERARYAAELYNQGYADKIIFSSGYIYRYNDAENMKLIALSAGVPEEDIILEKYAGSTYENVEFTKGILERQGWRRTLLVSSPYNMRRASLVFRKFDGKFRVTYTPVPNPQFYDRISGSRWQQTKAIFHEYLGIIYYWWKKYI